MKIGTALRLDHFYVLNSKNMLAVGDQYRKTRGAKKLAVDRSNSDEGVYWVPEGDFPLQKPHGIASPLKLVDPDWLLKNVFKKYSLSKKEIRLLTNFYEDTLVRESLFRKTSTLSSIQESLNVAT